MKLNKQAKAIFSVAGGKGGVGKSIFATALGVNLATAGHSVALVDLDLGAANLHTYLGIIKQTPTIADFILKKVSSLEELLLETSLQNLRIISGAEFVPGMANPAHWMKLKIVRHITALPADYIIIDLGAGVHFNTLDFFGMSDRGIVVTAPEPGAVMNAYSFVKAALFRKLQGIFKKHPDIGPLIEAKTKNPEEDKKFSLEWLTEKTGVLAPDMLPLIAEVEKDFSPALVVNRIDTGKKHVLVDNLMSLCEKRLGLSMEHLGNLPDVPGIRDYLLDIPRFLGQYAGKPYLESVKEITGKLLPSKPAEVSAGNIKTAFDDDELDDLNNLIEGLDDNVFGKTNRNTLKLRLYFKPSEVINFLISRGVTNKLFYS
jgi:flagellar biosynthesis protein FlhG